MIVRIARLAVAAASITCVPVPASAQPGPGPAFDAKISLRTGEGGTYLKRGGFALELTGALPLRQVSAGTLVGGLGMGVESPFWKLTPCVRGPDGYCIPDFPGMIYVGGLWGIERGSRSSGWARALAGPYAYGMFTGDKGVGVQGRVDLATRARGGVSLVASLRQDVLPSVRGEVLGITSLGAGVRIHR
ncbi:MAG TPA: hypothetical protein VEY93_15665 [Longimicrobium sp.]|nr:hypothetical protein [Longimicrobium sp.]